MKQVVAAVIEVLKQVEPGFGYLMPRRMVD